MPLLALLTSGPGDEKVRAFSVTRGSKGFRPLGACPLAWTRWTSKVISPDSKLHASDAFDAKVQALLGTQLGGFWVGGQPLH